MVGTRDGLAEQCPAAPPNLSRPLRIVYVAYPSSLILRSANAVQTYATVRELQGIAPNLDLLIPRFARRQSAFAALGATHLLRLPFNAGRHLVRSVMWSYAERTWFSLRVLLRLARRRLMRDAPAVIYVRDVVCATWLTLLARVVGGAAVIFEVHDLEAENRSANSGPVARAVARWMDTVAIGRAAGIVSLTATFLPEIASRRHTDMDDTVTVIPDAYDDAVYFPRDRAAARDALGLAPGAFVVAYSGLTFAYHGVDLLIEAFDALVRCLPSAHLLLVGGRDAERDAVARQIATLGLDGRVTIVPPQPVARVPHYLAAADALVIPDTVTKASASPLKLFEYAAMGTVIVAADLPALKEILPDNAARYVQPGDADALADGLRWVAEHPVEAAERAERARSAVAQFTYRARAAAIVAFCERIAEADG